MADPDAVPVERARATWSAVLDAMPARRALVLSYVEALAQAERDPLLQAQFAAQYRRFREQTARLVAQSLGDDLAAHDPRCTAVASFVRAVCDGLALQFLLDAQDVPTGDELTARP